CRRSPPQLTGEFGLTRSSWARHRAHTLSFPARCEDNLLLLLKAFYKFGVEGIRTLYLFNAIEALSQVSYDPASGDDGIRTHYLFSAIEALSQLSYVPVVSSMIIEEARFVKIATLQFRNR